MSLLLYMINQVLLCLCTYIFAFYFLRYIADEEAKRRGHIVLRLPPYHCEYNPIEIFDQENPCRLDEFWVNVIKLKSSPNFLDFVKMMLILSHGNAGLERGFSINKELLVENLTQKSLVAQRMVYDAVTAAGGEHEIVIDKEMIHAARNAHGLYKEDLERRAAERRAADAKAEAKKRAAEELKNLKAKKAKLLTECTDQASKLDEEISELNNFLNA